MMSEEIIGLTVIVIFLTIVVILLGGEPSILDAISHRIMECQK